ncbi:Hypothetical predicted protein [Paramuricea clavata]|uniref:Uncharacterized protein n=1 Tax=Paramuricea clavata TaxID=317549 RepID=A0A6S7FP54_PARCT|nr:Hypothetical predicted protein [Paramuricea clavata]
MAFTFEKGQGKVNWHRGSEVVGVSVVRRETVGPKRYSKVMNSSASRKNCLDKVLKDASFSVSFFHPSNNSHLRTIH